VRFIPHDFDIGCRLPYLVLGDRGMLADRSFGPAASIIRTVAIWRLGEERE